MDLFYCVGAPLRLIKKTQWQHVITLKRSIDSLADKTTRMLFYRKLSESSLMSAKNDIQLLSQQCLQQQRHCCDNSVVML